MARDPVIVFGASRGLGEAISVAAVCRKAADAETIAPLPIRPQPGAAGWSASSTMPASSIRSHPWAKPTRQHKRG